METDYYIAPCKSHILFTCIDVFNIFSQKLIIILSQSINTRSQKSVVIEISISRSVTIRIMKTDGFITRARLERYAH